MAARKAVVVFRFASLGIREREPCFYNGVEKAAADLENSTDFMMKAAADCRPALLSDRARDVRVHTRCSLTSSGPIVNEHV